MSDPTDWLMVAGTVVVVAAVWSLHRLRVRQIGARLRERLEIRHLERERVAREVLDTLLQSVQGLMLRFSAAMVLVPETHPSHAVMEKGLLRAEAVLSEGRDRVLDMRDGADSGVGLGAALEGVAHELGALCDAQIRIDTDGDERPLRPDVSDACYRIAREALFNACHHAQAAEIRVALVYGPSELQVKISDDGVGIPLDVADAGNRSGHWGLPWMKERAGRIDARLEIRRRMNGGTVVQLTVPAAAAYPGRRLVDRLRQRLRPDRSAP